MCKSSGGGRIGKNPPDYENTALEVKVSVKICKYYQPKKFI